MPGKRRPVQRPLPLLDESPAKLAPKAFEELARALAELMLAALRSDSAATTGGGNEYEADR